jgi:hypothetical protein
MRDDRHGAGGRGMQCKLEETEKMMVGATGIEPVTPTMST